MHSTIINPGAGLIALPVNRNTKPRPTLRSVSDLKIPKTTVPAMCRGGEWLREALEVKKVDELPISGWR